MSVRKKASHPNASAKGDLKVHSGGLRKSDELPNVDLTVAGVRVTEGGLYLRQGMADANIDLPSGEKLRAECAVLLGGQGVLVTIYPPKVGGDDDTRWRTYLFPSESLLRAGLDAYLDSKEGADAARVEGNAEGAGEAAT